LEGLEKAFKDLSKAFKGPLKGLCRSLERPLKSF
jgi:hypothetical protein